MGRIPPLLPARAATPSDPVRTTDHPTDRRRSAYGLSEPPSIPGSALLGLVAALGVGAVARAQPCGLHWSDAFAANGPDYAEVSALIMFDDDGPGPSAPALYVGGLFHRAGDAAVGNVARWDGAAWHDVGGGVHDGVHAFAAFDDDGPGPNPPTLFAGTLGRAYYGTSAIVRLVDGQWSPVPGVGEGWVTALLPFDTDGDGPGAPVLLAGGYFQINGEYTMLAEWDGASWTSISEQMDGTVLSLLAIDEDGDGPNGPVLIAGGGFDVAGPGFAANGVARWDGKAWSPLGDGLGMYATVWTLAWYDDDGPGRHPAQLYAGGNFYRDFGAPADSFAVWSGAQWKEVRGDVNGVSLQQLHVRSLLVVDEDGDAPGPAALFVGGAFTSVDGRPICNLAAWTGDDWKPEGDPNFPVQAMLVDTYGARAGSTSIIAAGAFTQIGGQPAFRVAGRHDETWSALGAGLGDGATGFNVYPPGADAFYSGPNALASFDPDGAGPESPKLIAGGFFTSAGSVAASDIAQWDGHAWSTLGTGLDDQAMSMTTFDTDADGPEPTQLYVGGYFYTAGSVTTGELARWDGHAWSAVPGWDYGFVFGVKTADEDGPGPSPSALYVCGIVLHADDTELGGVARWDGLHWTGFGDGIDNNFVNTIAYFDEDGDGPAPPTLYAGCMGNGGAPGIGGLARFDGTSWSTVGGGLWGDLQHQYGGRVYALAVHDDDGLGPHRPALYVGGDFYYHDSAYAPGIVRWTGSTWESVGFGLTPYAACMSIVRFDDDGAGPQRPALFVGGWNFTHAGSTVVNRIARWNGSSWAGLADGVTGRTPLVNSLVVHDTDGVYGHAPHLYAGGEFTTAGGVPSQRVADWGQDCTGCAGDLNGDGQVGSTDLGILIGSWGPGAGGADITQDGRVDSADLASLLGAWGPCPMGPPATTIPAADSEQIVQQLLSLRPADDEGRPVDRDALLPLDRRAVAPGDLLAVHRRAVASRVDPRAPAGLELERRMVHVRAP